MQILKQRIMSNNDKSNYTKRGEFSKRFWNKLETSPWKDIIEYASKVENGLDVQLRGGYINIYYNGGNILRIHPQTKFFDEFYFYDKCKKNDRNTRKTIILEEVKKGNKEAKNIVDGLIKQKEILLKNIPNNYEEYFDKAKKVIDNWLKKQNDELGITHYEKKTQQAISLHNKEFSGDNDLVVVDVEFAISQKSRYFKKKENPRPDIIAIDKKGQIHVMELKYGLKATEGKAGIEKHLNDFVECTSKGSKDFLEDMSLLIESKKKLKLIDSNCKVDKNLESPVFDLIIKGSEKDYTTIKNKYKTEISNIIWLDENNDSFKLKLQ